MPPRNNPNRVRNLTQRASSGNVIARAELVRILRRYLRTHPRLSGILPANLTTASPANLAAAVALISLQNEAFAPNTLMRLKSPRRR